MALTKKPPAKAVSPDAYADLINLIYAGPNAFIGALTEAISDGELDSHIRKIAKACFVRRYELEEGGEKVPVVPEDTDMSGMVPSGQGDGYPVVGDSPPIFPKAAYRAHLKPGTFVKVGTNRYSIADMLGKAFRLPETNVKPQAMAGVLLRVSSVDPRNASVGVEILSSPNRNGRYMEAYRNQERLWIKPTPSSSIRALFET